MAGPSQIFPWLYVGDQTDAIRALSPSPQPHGFDLVLSVMDAPLELLTSNVDGDHKDGKLITHKFIHLVDAKKSASDGTLDAALELAWDFLNRFADQKGIIELDNSADAKILIHCRAGRSRSVTTAAMFLMRRFRMTAHQALRAILERRPIASPNSAFVETLERIEQELRSTSPLSYPAKISFCNDSSHFIARKLRKTLYENAEIVSLNEQMAVDENSVSQCSLDMSLLIEELVLCNCPLGSTNSPIFTNLEEFSWGLLFISRSLAKCDSTVAVFLLDIIRMLVLDAVHVELLVQHISSVSNQLGFVEWLIGLVPQSMLESQMGLKIGIARIVANVCSLPPQGQVALVLKDVCSSIGLLLPMFGDIVRNGVVTRAPKRSDSEKRFALEGIEAISAIIEFLSSQFNVKK